MSWPLASFLLVGLVLAAGWLAYERRRPSARMVAVVATLSAVAALGRDMFVALPDVKPITAIAFVVGYGLGPLPGFTVGAIGMLASNVMLGQGPYTPWQMAAWGLVGLAGAALGRLSGRRLPRLPLACACAGAALAAKEIMNVYTWTMGASHTPAAFLAVAGTALPFDLTDTIATLLFALAFGPELARLLGRTRERMTVHWEHAAPGTVARTLAILTLVAGATLGRGGAPARAWSLTSVASGGAPSMASAGGARARPPDVTARAASLSGELSFLTYAQNGDGGFGAARGQGSSELYTAWAAMGLAAAGRDPAYVRRGGHSVLDSLRREASTLRGLGDVERTILAARACGASAYSFAGRDLVAEVLRARARAGSFEHQVNLTAFAIFALRAVGHSSGFPAIRKAAGWIERQQNGDGGFGFGARGSGSDVDDTGAALQALADAGARNARMLGAAAGYLIRSQNLDGGLPQRYGEASNAQSTAWAAQGLIAAGLDAGSVRRRGSRSPIGYLESLVTFGGSVRYSRTSAQTPVWVTSQVMVALAGRIFPVVW
ncbi:MAG TPA: prenyltransferase/squalene oxidase repeat-containing protein [Solirubrobacteraceae bacterium]|nr:prenyltransferase/squalene oxidase repeat-containing protein [Solirubrobacteraceae bacterium]